MYKTKMIQVYLPSFQFCIFSLVINLFVLGIQPIRTHAQSSSELDNRQAANTVFSIEPEILSEINRVRTNPQDYAQWLEKQRQYYDGIWLKLPGEKPVRTNKGMKALEEAIALLKKQQPLAPLSVSQAVASTATNQLDNFATANNIQYISYGRVTAQGIVMGLVVDDLFPDRRRRNSLLNPDANNTGVVCKPDPRYAKVCAIAYSDSANSVDVAEAKPSTARTSNDTTSQSETTSNSPTSSNNSNSSVDVAEAISTTPNTSSDTNNQSEAIPANSNTSSEANTSKPETTPKSSPTPVDAMEAQSSTPTTSQFESTANFPPDSSDNSPNSSDSSVDAEVKPTTSDTLNDSTNQSETKPNTPTTAPATSNPSPPDEAASTTAILPQPPHPQVPPTPVEESTSTDNEDPEITQADTSPKVAENSDQAEVSPSSDKVEEQNTKLESNEATTDADTEATSATVENNNEEKNQENVEVFEAEDNSSTEVATNSDDSGVLENVERGALAEGDRVITEDGSLYDSYPLEGKAGDSLTIYLESDEFDPFVALIDAKGDIVEQNDDIDEEDSNSRIQVTIPEDGTYNVIVNAYDQGGKGEYILTVRR